MASQEFKTHRVTELPAVLEAYAVYFVAPAGTTDYVEIYVTSSDGTSARRVINEQNVSSASVKEKYESNPNTNAFTDSLRSKLESLPTEGAKGEKGDPFLYIDFTTGQLEALKGDRGKQGEAGTNATNGTVKNQNTGLDTKIWIGTQQEYDDLIIKDSDTLYMVK